MPEPPARASCAHYMAGQEDLRPGGTGWLGSTPSPHPPPFPPAPQASTKTASQELAQSGGAALDRFLPRVGSGKFCETNSRFPLPLAP